jgi:tetratricopeptide (TPR) repeat protein
VEATAFLAVAYLTAGQIGAAAPVVERLLAIDPLTPINHSLKGYWLFMRRRVSEALVSYRRLFEMDPRSPLARVLYARMLALAGEEENAKALLAQIDEGSRGHILAEHGVILHHLLTGRDEDAASAITPEVVEASRYDDHLSWWMAGWHSLLGNSGEAVEWLRHASNIGFLNYPMVAELDRFLDGIRSDPGYVEFAEELRVRWEAFEV